ncbi:hypothetical protein GCM10010965_25680 [Caldalkalibacillus thermarum]|uniref:hypothetical protein n=1 Tax=Caldalkalibacillus thermarum TaxID=296745 RepID=UPI00166BF537|nr:hypothetical protein [Caldalkalibacillus thermarum]GGK31693.1 hypothetical protein GCM10010965_25680 [Caldalkalibacillus thermarum]
MTEIADIIQQYTHIGYMLKTDGFRLGVPKQMPREQAELLFQHKREVIAYLCDKEAKQAGFVIGVPGEIYFATVRRDVGYEMTVYMERQGTTWQVWRETYTKGKPTATKDIYSGTSFTTALQKAIRYIQAVRR